MALRIAFDLDGVLADMEGELLRQATILFGIDFTHPQKSPAGDSLVSPADATDVDAASIDEPPVQSVALTARQQRRLWQHVKAMDGFWESLNETEPGVVARLGELATARHWEVIFLTRRPATAGATAQLQSQRWLAAKGFAFPSVYVVNGSRGRIAAALGLDIVVDDTPQNCLDVAADSKARVIGVFPEPDIPQSPALRRLGIHVVRSATDAFNVLCEIDAGLQRQPGAIDRVMRFLGLTGSAPN